MATKKTSVLDDALEEYKRRQVQLPTVSNMPFRKEDNFSPTLISSGKVITSPSQGTGLGVKASMASNPLSGIAVGAKGAIPSSPAKNSINQLSLSKSSTQDGYQSPYSTQIQGLLDQILNRQSFNYDVNADPLYKQLSQQAVKNGNLAMRDTMGNAAALTGGYGNSYATTAGSQANDAYMQDLNSQIPQLAELAYNKYENERTNLLNNLSALQGLESTAYGKYRDTVADQRDTRDFNYNKSVNDRNYNYQVGRDAVGDKQWQQTYNRGVVESDRAYNRQVGLDKQAQSNYLNDRTYNRGQDALDRQEAADQKAYNRTQDTQNRIDSISDKNYARQQDTQDRADAKTQAEAETSAKNIEKYSEIAQNMLKEKSSLGLQKYTPEQVRDYLEGLWLSDDEVASIINDIYELRRLYE